MEASVIFWLFVLFFLKHFALDFLYQPPYQWKNKGSYGHLGGILHALQHAIGSFLTLLFFIDAKTSLLLALLEFVLHYHIDWAKMNINKKLNLKCDTSEGFWWLLGLDQLLHYLTYALMVFLAFLA